MRLPKKIQKKYRNNGLISLIESGGSLAARKTLKPIGAKLYTNSRNIRYEDFKNHDNIVNVIQIDERNEIDNRYEVPFGLDVNDEAFRNLPRYSFRNQYVAELHNVLLLGPDALPVTSEGEILCEAIEPFNENGYRVIQAINRTISDPHSIKQYILNNKKEFDCVCSLSTTWDNYYHWIIEHLPKLRALEIAEEEWGVQATPIIPANPPSYVIESLELLGYKPKDCIEWEGGVIHAKSYIQPTFTEPTKQVCDWLRRRALSNIQERSKKNKSNRVYISRRKATDRNIKNEHEVESILHKFGFKTYTTEDLRVSEQVSLFNNAEVVIGAHGAGLTDMIWSSNVHVIEIFNNVVKPPYFQISDELGHEYHPVRGKSVNNNGYNSNICVDTDELRGLLEDII